MSYMRIKYIKAGFEYPTEYGIARVTGFTHGTFNIDKFALDEDGNEIPCGYDYVDAAMIEADIKAYTGEACMVYWLISGDEDAGNEAIGDEDIDDEESEEQ